MSNDAKKERYQRLYRMVKNVETADPEFRDKLLMETKNNLFIRSLKRSVKEEDTGREADLKRDYKTIVQAAVDYIKQYPAPASFKNRQYKKVYELCAAIGSKYGIENYKEHLSNIEKPVECDLAVEIIKELHKGVTKKELAESYKVSTKTIQTTLHRLSGENGEKPLRIGGHSIRVPAVEVEQENKNAEWRFSTPNTLSPIIFQLNIMQVATLLQALYYSYEKDNNIPLDLAIDTWSQLTDHAKSRIRKIFCLQDPGFSDFIDIVEEEAESFDHRFMSEREMLAEEKLRNNEILLTAWKGGLICDIVLLRPMRSRKNRKIAYDFDCKKYYALPADGQEGEREYFDENDLQKLIIIDD